MKNTFIPSLFILAVLLTSSSAFAKVAEAVKTTLPNSDSSFVINLANETERSYYQRLNLDEDHPNLLAPGISPEEFQAVRSSWVELHQGLGNHLKANGFSWGVPDDNISIVHKIYFTPSGTVKNYCFKVVNQDVTFAKTEAFSLLAEAFFQEVRINQVRKNQFAQCGKTRYPNQVSPENDGKE